MRSTHIFRTLRTRESLKRLLKGMGYELRQYTPLRSFAAAREALLRDVDVVVDVGANAGQYGELLRESLGQRDRQRSADRVRVRPAIDDRAGDHRARLLDQWR